MGRAEESERALAFRIRSLLLGAMERRRFPAPWTVEELPGGYAVNDAAGKRLAFVYAAEGARLSAMPYALTWDEARRIAAGIARLPELLGTRSEPKP